MSDSEAPGVHASNLATPHGLVSGTPRAMTLYLLGLVLTPVVMLTAAFFLIPTPWFARHSQNAYLANLGYGETLHHADCKILVYGDSAALVGVNPLILQQITGLSACNIAEFAGMTMVNGMMVPDRYLANNPRPLYLVFLFTPEGLGPQEKWQWVSTFEGIFYRLQHKRDRTTVRLFLKHPAEFLGWLEVGLRLGLTHAADRPYTGAELHLRAPHRGQLPIPNAVATGCGLIDRYAEPNPQWMHHLRTTYGVGGTRVLIDVVPEAECDPSYPFYKKTLAGLTDNTLQLYPIQDYVPSGRLHMNSAGSLRLSTDLGNQIAALERAR